MSQLELAINNTELAEPVYLTPKFFRKDSNKIVWENPVAIVSPDGMRAVRRLIRDWGVSIPEDFDSRWVTHGGEIQGKLPTRIKKWLKVYKRYDMDKSQQEQIGNLASQFVIQHEKYTFDFDSDFDWEAGDFGDGGSCYWESRAGARDMLRDHNSLAVRFYSDKCQCNCHNHLCHAGHDCSCGWNNCECCNSKLPDLERKCCGHFHQNPRMTGAGRCWLIFDEGLAIIFNAYGPFQLSTIAQVLAAKYGLTSTKVCLLNRGDADGLLYINGATGIVLSKTQHNGEQINLYWEDMNPEYYAHCDCCGIGLDEEDCYGQNDMTDNTYCSGCYRDRFGTCSHCGNESPVNELTRLGGNNWCIECRDEHYFRCQDCNRWTNYDEETVVWRDGEERRVGHSCAENYTRCDECEDLHWKNEVTTLENRTLCPVCLVDTQNAMKEVTSEN